MKSTLRRLLGHMISNKLAEEKLIGREKDEFKLNECNLLLDNNLVKYQNVS